MTDNNGLYLFGTIIVLGSFSIVAALSSPLAGMILSGIVLAGGIFAGSLISADSEFDRKFGIGMLSDSEARSASAWGALTLSAFLLFVFDEVFFIAAVLMIGYAVLAYFVENTSDQRRMENLLQRLGVAMLLFIAQFLSGLLIIIVAVLMARYAWVFIPSKYKQSIEGGGN